jgi:hypothetical protein
MKSLFCSSALRPKEQKFFAKSNPGPPGESKVMVPIFRLTVFFAIAASAFAAGALTPLVIAAEGYAIAIQQQIAIIQSVTTPVELAAKTISYAAAKTAYYDALKAAVPELTDVATGKEPRPPEVDQFARAFSAGGEKQAAVADEATAALLTKLPYNADLEKAKMAFSQALSVQAQFHHDFNGIDLSGR